MRVRVAAEGRQAARRFFEQAIGTTKLAPVEVVIDKAAAYPAVLEAPLRRHGIGPIGTPTTASGATTAG
jgi:hypothetical protein